MRIGRLRAGEGTSCIAKREPVCDRRRLVANPNDQEEEPQMTQIEPRLTSASVPHGECATRIWHGFALMAGGGGGGALLADAELRSQKSQIHADGGAASEIAHE